MRCAQSMTGLVIALLLNSSNGTYGLRLVDADEPRSRGSLTEMTVAHDRPSLASVIVPGTFGALFTVTGSGGVVFGLAMMLASGNSLYSGIALGIGIISAGIGALVLIGGVVCIMMAARNNKARGGSDDDDKPRRFRPTEANPYVVEAAPSKLVTVAMF